MRTVNIHIVKLDLEKAEEPEIKLPTSAGSLKKQESSRKNYFCFIDYVKSSDCVDHNKLWKILKEMEIADHLTCLMSNLYAGQEATVRTGHGTTNGFYIGKEYIKAVCCLFNLYTEYIMRNAGLDEAQAGVNSSLISSTRVVSSAYLRLLIFVPAILIPAYASSSPVFLLMY